MLRSAVNLTMAVERENKPVFTVLKLFFISVSPFLVTAVTYSAWNGFVCLQNIVAMKKWTHFNKIRT